MCDETLCVCDCVFSLMFLNKQNKTGKPSFWPAFENLVELGGPNNEVFSNYNHGKKFADKLTY